MANENKISNVEWLMKNFTGPLNLPNEAAQWLCQLYGCIQFFDDVVDEDKISRGRFDQALWDSLVGMNLNSFFIQNSYQLLPLTSSMILKWQASDKVERNGHADEKSYVWRAGYYDIVLMVVSICHGYKIATEMSDKVLALYGESYESYIKEFSDA